MSRRLNPELFNTAEKGSEMIPPPLTGITLRQLQKELKQTQKKLSTVESLVELLQTQLKTMGENGDKKTEAFSKAITDLEKNFQEESLTQKHRSQQVTNRLKEREIADEQIQSLIERFNNNIAQFENKLAALKNTLSEKQMNLISYREIIEQLVHDVEKLKHK